MTSDHIVICHMAMVAHGLMQVSSFIMPTIPSGALYSHFNGFPH